MPARPRQPYEYYTSRSPVVQAQGQFNDTGMAPEGYDVRNGNVIKEESGLSKFLNEKGWWAVPAGILGGTYLASGFGGGAGAGAGSGSSSGLPFASTVDTGLIPTLSDATLATAGGSGAAGAGNVAGGSFLSKLFGNRGLDPTALFLGGLSMFGGDEGEDPRESFAGNGAADPIQALNKALSLIDTLGASLQDRQGPNLRSSQLAQPPAPVSIPGIPFQIGGGLATDPALRDATLLMGQPTPEAGFGGRQAEPKPRRRNPNADR